jgi:hypothetical protein
MPSSKRSKEDVPQLSFPSVPPNDDIHGAICRKFQQSAQALHHCEHACTRTLRRRSIPATLPASPGALQGHLDDEIDPQFSKTIQHVLSTLLTYERLFRKNAVPPMHAQTQLLEVYEDISDLLGELTAYAGEATSEISVITQMLISLTIRKHGQRVTEAVARFADALRQESARLEEATKREEEEAVDLCS